MTFALPAGTLAALAVLGLVGGVGITALGPGGVLPTIGLFALTGLPASTVAGTAIVTHVATGLIGSAAYLRSGELTRPHTRRTAAVLAAAAAVGTPVGVLINTVVSTRTFGIVLAGVVAATAVLLWYRLRGATAVHGRHPRTATVAAVGLGVALASGIVGVGGPMLAVPLLLACGVPILEALAAAQVQSIVIAAVGTVGFAVHGSIDWPLALLIGVPEAVGVLLGWRIARALPTRTLQAVLIAVLLALAPYLALTA